MDVTYVLSFLDYISQSMWGNHSNNYNEVCELLSERNYTSLYHSTTEWVLTGHNAHDYHFSVPLAITGPIEFISHKGLGSGLRDYNLGALR